MQKYEILSAIGQGAYGVVLKCKDIQNNNFVAIKKFKQSDDDQNTKKTTMRQVKILKMMNHTNIVQLKEAFRKKGIVYLVFQYIQNNLLQVLQKSSNGIKLPLIRKLMYQLLKGLLYLHEQNIIHRDIKPQNLLVSVHYLLKICDFGFARQIKKQKGQQITDYVATRWYRPPELLVGDQYGKQIDLWAVGCIMCQLIDGNPLFPGQNQLDQLFLIQKSLGPLPPDLHERFIKNQRFLGMKFPKIQSLDQIEKKYLGKIQPKGLSFIKSLLKMNPAQRLTAKQALEHPYFQPQRQKQMNNKQDRSVSNSRQGTYTATTNRQQYDIPTTLQRHTKYGKIYNKKSNFEAMAQIYKSTNNVKLLGSTAKSIDKPVKKHTNNNNNNNISLQKHQNKDILMKTQAQGFFFQCNADKMTAISENAVKKNTQTSWQSSSQFPFLIGTNTTSQSPSKKLASKFKKPQPQQVVFQRQIFNIKQIINKH